MADTQTEQDVFARVGPVGCWARQDLPRRNHGVISMCEEYQDLWCGDFDAHKAAHEFCEDHQNMWCRLCDRGCPNCVDDPHCPECHVALFQEEHDWDCSYYGEDDADD